MQAVQWQKQRSRQKSLKFQIASTFLPLGWRRSRNSSHFLAPCQHLRQRASRATRHSYGLGNRGHVECRHLDEQIVMRQWVYMIIFFRGDRRKEHRNQNKPDETHSDSFLRNTPWTPHVQPRLMHDQAAFYFALRSGCLLPLVFPAKLRRFDR